jgi:hypothetical protein
MGLRRVCFHIGRHGGMRIEDDAAIPTPNSSRRFIFRKRHGFSIDRTASAHV